MRDRESVTMRMSAQAGTSTAPKLVSFANLQQKLMKERHRFMAECAPGREPSLFLADAGLPLDVSTARRSGGAPYSTKKMSSTQRSKVSESNWN